jgi:hypothetical protein
MTERASPVFLDPAPRWDMQMQCGFEAGTAAVVLLPPGLAHVLGRVDSTVHGVPPPAKSDPLTGTSDF